jgi:hypothetical protein
MEAALGWRTASGHGSRSKGASGIGQGSTSRQDRST